VTPEETKEMRERCEKATAGEWESDYYAIWLRSTIPIVTERLATFKKIEDAVFCAHARTDLPLALDEIERLQRDREIVILDITTQRAINADLHRQCDELREALAGVMHQVHIGALVRETADDNAPGWGMRQLPLVMALKTAQALLDKEPAK